MMGSKLRPGQEGESCLLLRTDGWLSGRGREGSGAKQVSAANAQIPTPMMIQEKLLGFSPQNDL